MLEILTVCTGNICRSPLAAQLLATRLADLPVRVASAGARARAGMPMTPEAADLAVARGVDPALVAAHGARYLAPVHVRTADLVLAMARDHRREVVELDPSRLRQTFTAREFARLTADLSDHDLRAAAATAGEAAPPRERFAAALGAIAGRRGIALPPASAEDDDVVDPYGRSTATYERSAAELEPGLAAVERVVRIAFG